MAKKKEPEYENVTPRQAEVSDFVETALTKITADNDVLLSLEISDQNDLDNASAALKDVAKQHDTLDAKRKSWVQPLKAVASDIDKTFKPALDALKRAEEILKSKIGKYWLAVEEERTRMLASASAAAEAKQYAKAERIIEKAEEFSAEKSEGVGVRIEWTGEVADENQIPREYMTPDIKKLLAVTKAMGDKTNIPGWRISKTTAIRTSRK